MAIKEAKVKTFDVLRFVADNAGLSTFEAIEKAYNTGVSEQKAVLNKIRAEIKELFKEPAYYIPNYDAYKKVLEVIDKYKAESENKG